MFDPHNRKQQACIHTTCNNDSTAAVTIGDHDIAQLIIANKQKQNNQTTPTTPKQTNHTKPHQTTPTTTNSHSSGTRYSSPHNIAYHSRSTALPNSTQPHTTQHTPTLIDTVQHSSAQFGNSSAQLVTCHPSQLDTAQTQLDAARHSLTQEHRSAAQHSSTQQNMSVQRCASNTTAWHNSAQLLGTSQCTPAQLGSCRHTLTPEQLDTV